MTQTNKGLALGLILTWSGCAVVNALARPTIRSHRIVQVGRQSPPTGIKTLPVAAGLRGAGGLDLDRMVMAVAQVESGNRNLPPRWDVNGFAFGNFQFHLPRWIEVGGTRANFGKAGPELQRRLFRKALARRMGSFEQVARWHNGVKLKGDPYVVKLKKAYAKTGTLNVTHYRV